MKRLAIIGSGDLGKLIAHHAKACDYVVSGFFDDFVTAGEFIEGIPVLGALKDTYDFYQKNHFDFVICGIGYKHMAFRKKIFDETSLQIPFANVIHPSVYIDSSVQLGQGIFILPGGVLDHNVKIGHNVLLNTGCVIAHDSEIKDHSFLAPSVKVAGFSSIGVSCIIGIGTVIIDNITLCDRLQTGAGAVVTKNLITPGLYVGIPARLSRKFE